jgi:trk system potassium uptake protein TrkA
VYILIVGGGKVGANLTSTLVDMGHEVTLLDNDRRRFAVLEARFGSLVRYGDATELYVLERAGVERAELLLAVTGDDEDNLVVCQVARDKYGVPKVIARVNDPRNQPHFDMLDVRPTVSATATILALIEHELPEHELVTLLDLRREDLEIVEFDLDPGSRLAGARVRDVSLPPGSRLISVRRGGRSEIVTGETELHAGDRLMAILDPTAEPALRRLLSAQRGVSNL